MSDDEEAREKSKEEVNDKVSKTLVEGEEFTETSKTSSVKNLEPNLLIIQNEKITNIL